MSASLALEVLKFIERTRKATSEKIETKTCLHCGALRDNRNKCKYCKIPYNLSTIVDVDKHSDG